MATNKYFVAFATAVRFYECVQFAKESMLTFIFENR